VNSATTLARLTVDELVVAGVGHVILCPGSRSAPLACALAAAEAAGGPQLHVRHDERVAAFTALGVGLSGDTVGAVLTTSGTAAANLHPAVLEAHHANRPLVVVTADRPPALRGTWANQTSELQAALFGAALRARVDLADTPAAAAPDAARKELAAALTATGGGPSGARPGPVHLNLGFTEPLVPDDDEPFTGGGPDAGWPLAASPGGVPRPVLHLAAGPRTVVLAGDGAGPAARVLAEAAGLPLLAEPSSGARCGPNAVGPYRLLLELATYGGAVERVVVFGRPTLSRPVTRLLARTEVDVVLRSPLADWPDPARPVARCASVTAEPGDAGWLAAWRAAGAAASAAIDVVLDSEAAAGRLTGPLLARQVWGALRPGQRLVAGSSNPIRDLDLAAHPSSAPMPGDPFSVPPAPPEVHANRGLAGIDGTVSTAAGLALATGPTRVLLGDVSFLHDVGSLLVGPGNRRPDLQVVVLNDGGCGIFGLLEYGERTGRGSAGAVDVDRLFGAPHLADLGVLCRGYGVHHELVTDAVRLASVLADPVPGMSVVEVPADRSKLRDLHARLRAAVHAAVVT
jgi:2-succinyl-5-enolpyruvyl-6-hydroxy-3-cyclohexene-1-carboxylate synthase